MKKWAIILILVLIAIASFSSIIYSEAIQPKKAGYLKAEKAAKQKGITKLDDFYLYNGSKTYYIAVGKNEKGKRKVIWVPAKGKDIVLLDYSKGMSKRDIVSLVTKELKPQKIVSVKLGMENDVPLWEVVYQNGSNRINYEYFDFETGEWLKYYRSI